MFTVSIAIPQISDEEIMERYQKVKPVVKVSDEHHYLKKLDLFRIRDLSYLCNLNANIGNEVKGLVALEGKDFICLHKYAYPKYFIPTVAEVLAQISEEDLQVAKAFEIIENSDDLADDVVTKMALEKGYHLSKVRLYTFAN